MSSHGDVPGEAFRMLGQSCPGRIDPKRYEKSQGSLMTFLKKSFVASPAKHWNSAFSSLRRGAFQKMGLKARMRTVLLTVNGGSVVEPSPCGFLKDAQQQQTKSIKINSNSMKEEEQTSECVGSLLVHSSDLQELSEVAAPSFGKTTECVGTMLIDTKDVQELSDAPVTMPDVLPTLQKRATVGTLFVSREDVASHAPPTNDEAASNKKQDENHDDHHDHRPEMM